MSMPILVRCLHSLARNKVHLLLMDLHWGCQLNLGCSGLDHFRSTWIESGMLRTSIDSLWRILKDRLPKHQTLGMNKGNKLKEHLKTTRHNQKKMNDVWLMCKKDSKGLDKTLRSPWSPAANQYFVGSLPQLLDHMACPSSFWMTPSAGRAHSVSYLDVGPVVWTPGADSAPLALLALLALAVATKGRRPRRKQRPPPRPRHSTSIASLWTLELQLARHKFSAPQAVSLGVYVIKYSGLLLTPLMVTRCQWTLIGGGSAILSMLSKYTYTFHIYHIHIYPT